MREPATHSTASEAHGLAGEHAGSEQETIANQPRFELERLIGYEVLDKLNENIGSVTAFWSDQSGKPAYIGVKTLWLVGKSHVVPAYGAELNHARKHLRLPFASETVKDAPSFDPDAELDAEKEREVCDYYQTREPGISGHGYGMAQQERTEGYPTGASTTGASTTEASTTGASTTGASTTGASTTGASTTGASTTEASATGNYPESQTGQATGEETRMPIREEELAVGKRSVEAGGVRLRKIVRSETVEQPVEVKREDVEVERVPASESQAEATSGQAFEGEEIYIPLWREEPVVSKEAHVREEVRARKTEESERETVSGEVRKEDVEVQDQRKEPTR